MVDIGIDYTPYVPDLAVMTRFYSIMSKSFGTEYVLGINYEGKDLLVTVVKGVLRVIDANLSDML